MLMIFNICAGVFANPSTAANIVVTIRPLHSIVSALTQHVSEPQLMLGPGEDAHHASLKPSQLRMLSRAQLIVRIGPTLEAFLNSTLEKLTNDGELISAIELQGMNLMQYEGGIRDPHIWLSPKNAMVAATAIAAKLVLIDPANIEIYEHNLSQFETNITHLETELAEILAPANGHQYLVNHDALRYFSRDFKLNIRPIGPRNEDTVPSAKQISAISELISSKRYHCVIVGNSANSSAIRTIAQDAGLPVAILDAMGERFASGDEQYFQMLRGIATDIAKCN